VLVAGEPSVFRVWLHPLNKTQLRRLSLVLEFVSQALLPMPTLQPIPFPLPLNGPPAGFAYDQRSISQISNTTYLNEILTKGNTSAKGCLICDQPFNSYGPCYIIPESEDGTVRLAYNK